MNSNLGLSNKAPVLQTLIYNEETSKSQVMDNLDNLSQGAFMILNMNKAVNKL